MPGMSKLEICQMACIESGGVDPISSLEEKSAAAKALDKRYEAIVRNELAQEWRFATAQLLATHHLTAPATTYTAAYEIPAEVLYIRRVFLDDARLVDYDRYGSRILYLDGDADSEVYVEGTYRINEDEWPAYFVELVTFGLAALLARHVARDAEMANVLDTKQIEQRTHARHTDSKQQPARKLPSSGFILRRQ